ncbi:MAG: ABC transporter ATP-binding protein [Chitinophagaceae bacterium]|jgi:lipoprotein-releasing system ATP-binding protein
MLTARGIEKSYGDLRVLRGLDLSVQQGEMLSIVGSSGAGKTTLLHILGGLDRPDRGEVVFNGRRFDHLQAKELAHFRNQHIGFVFQFHHLLPEFTALENICMPAWIAGNSGGRVEKEAMELMERLSIAERADHKPTALSGGEQQRVAVARALINGAEMILADEPTGNLDSSNAQSLHALFRELRSQFNRTFIIVTHNDELASLSDRVVHLKDGNWVDNH